MFSFLFLCIPSILLIYCFSNKNIEHKKFILPGIIFFFLAVIVCFIREFFIFTSQVITESLIQYIFQFSLWQFTIPYIFIETIFIFFSKDNETLKKENFFTVAASYFMVTVPYNTVTNDDITSFFVIGILPMLILSIIIINSYLIKISYQKIKENNKFKNWLLLLPGIALTFIPSLIKGIWYFKICPVLSIILSIITIISGIVIFVKFLIKEDKNARIPIFMTM